jgi:hypothetical protein
MIPFVAHELGYKIKLSDQTHYFSLDIHSFNAHSTPTRREAQPALQASVQGYRRRRLSRRVVEMPKTGDHVMTTNPNPIVNMQNDARRARGRPKSAEVGNRFHISIPDSLTNRLSEIQRDTHASSITEVVKEALQLYAAAVEEHKNGGHVYFKRKDEGVERQLALFI